MRGEKKNTHTHTHTPTIYINHHIYRFMVTYTFIHNKELPGSL